MLFHPISGHRGRRADAPGLDLVLDEPSADAVRELLREVIDPELGRGL